MEAFIGLMKEIDWKEVVAVISASAFLLAAVALLAAVFRVKQIMEALREFRRSKSDLYQLLEAIERLESIAPKLKLVASDFEEDISDLKQSISSEQATQATPNLPGSPVPAPVVEPSNKWQEIRDLWREVRDNIEARIERLDGRRRRSYNQKSRVSYAEVVDMLFEDRALTQVQAEAAKAMNQRFLQLKPREKSEILDQDVQKFREWRNAFYEVNPQQP